MAPKIQPAAPQPKASKTASPSAQLGQSVPTPVLQKPEEGASPINPKNFRNHPDMENFFRFIYENDLRLEALHIIDEIIVNRATGKKKPSVTASA